MNKFKSSQAVRRVVTLAGALALISGSAFATAIGTGESNTAGTVNVSLSGITFSGFVPTAPLGSTQTGAFAGTTSVTQGNLLGTPTLTPNIVGWATFTGAAGGPIIFDLETINPGYGTGSCSSDAVGNSCTPSPLSGITLTQASANSVSITFTGTGIAYTGTSGSGSSLAVVSFTSQNNVPGTITAILAEVTNPNGSGFTDSVSATYDTTSTVPEPATLSMMGLGLLGLGMIGRRKRKV